VLEVDRRIAAKAVSHRVGRPVKFVAAPTQFGRLQAPFNERIHGPGVDELIMLLPAGRYLRIAAQRYGSF
jgi:hypothetical protein